MELVSRDDVFMGMALKEAIKAKKKDEVPVGAIIINEANQIIAKAHNQTIRLNDPSAHAEILAIRKAGRKISNYRLLNTTLYVTVEPCIMCMAAIVHARIQRVVFGTLDKKWGGAGSLYDFSADKRLNHHPIIESGILEESCRELMQYFFIKKRKLKNNSLKISKE